MAGTPSYVEGRVKVERQPPTEAERLLQELRKKIDDYSRECMSGSTLSSLGEARIALMNCLESFIPSQEVSTFRKVMGLVNNLRPGDLLQVVTGQFLWRTPWPWRQGHTGDDLHPGDYVIVVSINIFIDENQNRKDSIFVINQDLIMGWCICQEMIKVC